MRIIQKQNNSKRLIITVAIGVVLLAGGAAYAWFSPTDPFNLKPDDATENTVDYSKPKAAQQEAGNQAKKAFNEKQYSDDTSGTVNNESKQDVELLISSMNQNENTLTISTLVYTLDSTGECKVTLKRAGSNNVINQTAAHQISSYSACSDAVINVSDLAKGEWDVVVTYSAPTAKGEAVSKVTIQ